MKESKFKIFVILSWLLVVAVNILEFVALLAGRNKTSNDSSILRYSPRGFSDNIDSYAAATVAEADTNSECTIFAYGLSTLDNWSLHYTNFCEEVSGPSGQYGPYVYCKKHSPSKNFKPRAAIWRKTGFSSPDYDDDDGETFTSQFLGIRIYNNTALGLNETGHPLSQDISNIARNVSQSISADLGAWIADGHESTVPAFVLLCISLALTMVVALIMPYLALRAFAALRALFYIATVTSVLAAILLTASAASITHIIRSNTGTYDIFHGKIKGTDISVASDTEFLALTWVPVAVIYISTGMIASLTLWRHRQGDKQMQYFNELSRRPQLKSASIAQ